MTKADLNKNTNTLKRSERLKSRKIIASLFNKKEGSFFVCTPVIVAYKEIESPHFKMPLVAFTVSKSKFKHAVDRNRIKRLMRQAYRTNKHLFIEKLQAENKAVALMFIYKKNRIENLETIEKAVVKVLDMVKV